MDMKYHTRFPVYIQKHCIDNDETEEGEINDVSDTEDVDSTPSSPKNSLPLSLSKALSSFPAFVASPQYQCSVRRKPEVPRPYAVNQGGQFPGLAFPRPPIAVAATAPRSHGIISCRPLNDNAQPQTAPYTVTSANSGFPRLPFPPISQLDQSANRDLQGVPILQNSTVECTRSEEDPFDGLHDLEKMQLRMQLEEIESTTSNPSVSAGNMDGGFVGAMPPFMSALQTSEKAQMVAHMWFPAAPPPLTGVTGGSQKEIQRMHQLYHKACRLYERAVAKLSSTAGGAAKIDLASLPRPPSFPTIMLAAHSPVTLTTAGTTEPTCITVTSAQATTTGNGTTSATAAAAPTPLPVAAAIHSPEVYSAAYASAYRQTMTVMPKPGDGGPPPNTAEYTALWRCYLDYYLQYYLQHHNQPATATVTSRLSTGAATEAAAAETPTATTAWSSSNGFDSSPPSKRTRFPSDGGEQSSGVGNSWSSAETQWRSDAPVTPVQQGGGTAATVPSAKAEVIKATKTLLEPGAASEDGVETSKCVWISNLPTGVRAVDVKERCTPFGRVQTIKIIGSRKSKTPSIFAYLIMETVEAAVRLVEGLQGQTFQDKEIKVKRINALPIS